eukprot:PITA_26282
MPFGLINAGATFQRAMDIAFKGLINRIVVVYLDDITVFSRERSNHLQYFNQIFQRCKKYGISLNPTKSFFALDQVLTQINDHNLEGPISFYSSNLQGAELNYFEVEKQAFVVYKAVKHYRPFLLKAHTKVIVPFSSVRQLLIQKELGEKRENWVTALQEYDIEIKPAKIVKDQGFCRLLAGASNIPESSDTDQPEIISQVSATDSESQYANLIFYLKNGYAPPNLSYKNKRAIRLKAKNFTIIDDVLFKQNYDSVLLRCLKKQEAQKVSQELHDGPAGGHFGADTIAHKVIHA